ncbi:MAG: hypothetical protein KJ914_09605 [Gammaproteobacteria bacterium]|nr:hypothetical protein [Gammaproteobacteria bacterium]MBU1725783.1 hypothetical protein [Gammaproteobacteria bacterium]MBU2007286.1 hypothetical protein [Gammaproteobacteria bacterium]
MAQLVVKRVSWWSTPFAKQAMIWVPVAGFQAATLAGLGYFYGRLADVKSRPELAVDSVSLVSVAPAAVTRTIPVPKPVSLQPVMDAQLAQGTMQAGEGFSMRKGVPPSADVAAPAAPIVIAAQEPVGAPVEATVSSKALSSSAPARKAEKPVGSAPPVVLQRALEAQRTAEANRTDVDLSGNAVAETVGVTPLSRVDTDLARPFGGAPTPVGVVTWVYIGELRDYGWHGQKLHVASDSGLPIVGKNYRTQKIHGLYEQPHGQRAMGGFQQGDTVAVLEVIHEANNDVWVKVRKVRSVGH